MGMKNVLFITGIFPPTNVGIGRCAKLAKYLPDNGWNPIVLAMDKTMWRPQQDDSMLKDIQHLEVHRTKSGESKILQETIPIYLRKLGFNPRWWTVPDRWIRWKKHAIKEAEAIYQKMHPMFKQDYYRLHAIFSSGPPYTCHLVGLELKKQHKLPWVVDYRDFWTQQDASYSRRTPEEEVMEREVLEAADWVTIVNKMGLETLREKYPFIREKSSCITHGFDLEDYEGLTPMERTDNVVMLTYTGTIYGERTKGAEAFLKALKQFYDENDNAPLIVGFIGNCKPAERIAKELGLWQVHFTGWQDREYALEMLKASDVLLFILGDSHVDRHASTGKLFDYLGVGKPILAVAPKGVASAMLREVGVSTVVSPNDHEGIINAINKVTASDLTALTPDRRVAHELYSVKNKAQEMAEILERITK